MLFFKKEARTETDAGFRTDLLFVKAEFLIETADTSASIHHLLLSGKEGVTLGADFNADVLFGRPGFDHVAASTSDGGLRVVGMDAFLHVCSPLSLAKFRLGCKRNWYHSTFFRKKQQAFRIFLQNFKSVNNLPPSIV